jgi:hypothetical protein
MATQMSLTVYGDQGRPVPPAAGRRRDQLENELIGTQGRRSPTPLVTDALDRKRPPMDEDERTGARRRTMTSADSYAVAPGLRPR